MWAEILVKVDQATHIAHKVCSTINGADGLYQDNNSFILVLDRVSNKKIEQVVSLFEDEGYQTSFRTYS